MLSGTAESASDDFKEAVDPGDLDGWAIPDSQQDHGRPDLGWWVECFSLDRKEQFRFGVELDGDAHERQFAGSGCDSLGDFVLDHDQHPVGSRGFLLEELAEDGRSDRVGEVADQSVGRLSGDQGEGFFGIGLQDILFDDGGGSVKSASGESATGSECHRFIKFQGDERAVELGQTRGQGAVASAHFEDWRRIGRDGLDDAIEDSLVAQQVLAEARSTRSPAHVVTQMTGYMEGVRGVVVHLRSNAAMSLPSLAGSAQALPRHPTERPLTAASSRT